MNANPRSTINVPTTAEAMETRNPASKARIINSFAKKGVIKISISSHFNEKVAGSL
jgi:hypothetical protein